MERLRRGYKGLVPSYFCSRKMTFILYNFVVLLFLVTGTAARTSTPFIVFGDSTVDTGNNEYINTTLDFRASLPPNGQQFFGKPSGRFSNGRIFVDFICDYLGIPHISPFLQPDADHSNGINFGSGGAGVLPETNNGLVIPLETQLKYFTEFHKGQYETQGALQAKSFFSDSIYFVSIGNNDYMGGYFSVAALRERYTPQDFVAKIVSEIVGACEFLHSKGARKFVVLEVGPLGCIPALRQFHPTQGCFQPAGDLGVAHNHALQLALRSWESNHPDVTLLVAGLHNFMMDRISNPTSFGYKEGVAACCGSGALRGGGHCGRPNALTGEEYQKCDNPEDHVFWDFYHASERMHEEFAKILWSGPGAVTVRQLVDLTSLVDCGDEEVNAYGNGPGYPLDVHIERSSL